MVSKLLKSSSIFLSKKQNSILSAATILMFASFLSKILGLLRDRILASFFFGGQEWQLDVYNAAFRIPDMIFQLLVLGALSSAFIPVFSSIKDKKKSWQVVSSIITISSIIFIIFSLFFFIFSRQLSLLIAPDFSNDQISLMIKLSRLLLLSQFFFIISNFFTGVLQSYKRFLITAITPVLYNLGIIFGTLLLSNNIGIYGPIIGGICGAFAHFAFQYPFVKNLGFKFIPIIGFNLKEVKKIGKLMLPRTLGLAVEQIELTIAVRLSSAMTAGSLSIFYFAQHIFAIPIGIFGVTIGQAALPILSAEKNSLGGLARFKDTFISSFKNISYLALPASVIILILRVPIVRIAIGARDFPWEATLLTARTLSYLSVAIIAYSLVQLLVRAFYALEDTKTPLFVGTITVLINVFFSVYFTKTLNMNITGLALANSISGIFQAISLFLILNHKVKRFELSSYLPDFLKMIIAATLTGVALWIPMRLLDQFVLDTSLVIDLIILTLIAGISGILVYLIFSKILKIKQLDQFIKIFSRFGSYKKVLAKSEESISSSVSTPSTVSPDN